MARSLHAAGGFRSLQDFGSLFGFGQDRLGAAATPPEWGVN